MEKIKSILKSALLQGVMLLVGIAWTIVERARIVWKGHTHKSKHY